MAEEQPPLRCPAACQDKEAHEEYFRKYNSWCEKQGKEGLTVPLDSVDIHASEVFAIAKDHDEKCPLLYGARSLIQEIAQGMSIVLNIPAAAILSRIEVRCIESHKLICETRLSSDVSDRSRITFSHGFHFFCLNTSLLVAALLSEEITGKTSTVPLERARGLYEQQVSFFWEHSPKEALLFPYWEFDPKIYSFACEITFLMIAFLMAHEMAHLYVPVANIEKTMFGNVEEEARRCIETIPPPFFSHPPDPKWKDYWVEELLCDTLATMSILLCSGENTAALPKAPAIGERAQVDRYLAIEAVTMHVEALFWYNVQAGRDKALFGSFALYSKTHPLPNIRRVFLRGFAEQAIPDYRKMPRLYEAALKKLTPMPR